jgi:long-chain acyl-CoA synthetase
MPGDTISLLMVNKPELLVINWAAWSMGLKTVPLDSKRDTLERKLYKLQLTEASVLFVRTEQVDEWEIEQIRDQMPSVRVVELDTEDRYFDIVRAVGETGKSERLSGAKSPLDADCLIMFTSGTTSRPKGVRLTLGSLWTDAAQIMDWLKLSKDDRFHILLPLHHINSTTFSLATILSGGTILLSPRYSKSRFWKVMAEQKATLASIVPTIAYDLLSEQNAFEENKADLKQVSRIQLGSAPVQVNDVIKFYNQFKIPLIQGYGSTETSLRCTGVPYGLSEDEYLDVARTNSIGAEMCYNNVAVLDENNKECEEGAEGEICIRGPNVTRGYVKNDEQTEIAFSGGWYHSGDLGYWENMFGRKMFFIKGRLREIIIKGGVNISPLALEKTILDMFTEIYHCFVIGFPHPRFGEEIGVIADGKEQGMEALQMALKEGRISGLLPYECPRALIRVKHEELPKTSTGKVQRLKLKEKYGEKLYERSQKDTKK